MGIKLKMDLVRKSDEEAFSLFDDEPMVGGAAKIYMEFLKCAQNNSKIIQFELKEVILEDENAQKNLAQIFKSLEPLGKNLVMAFTEAKIKYAVNRKTFLLGLYLNVGESCKRAYENLKKLKLLKLNYDESVLQKSLRVYKNSSNIVLGKKSSDYFLKAIQWMQSWNEIAKQIGGVLLNVNFMEMTIEYFHSKLIECRNSIEIYINENNVVDYVVQSNTDPIMQKLHLRSQALALQHDADQKLKDLSPSTLLQNLKILRAQETELQHKIFASNFDEIKIQQYNNKKLDQRILDVLEKMKSEITLLIEIGHELLAETLKLRENIQSQVAVEQKSMIESMQKSTQQCFEKERANILRFYADTQKKEEVNESENNEISKTLEESIKFSIPSERLKIQTCFNMITEIYKCRKDLEDYEMLRNEKDKLQKILLT